MANLLDEVKVCTSCHLDLPILKFGIKGRSGKRYASCNRCRYILYLRPRRTDQARIIDEYKLAKGCMDCGYKEHAVALQFDHRPGTKKLFNIGAKTACNMERLWAEIDKCDVVCANCHAVRTKDRIVEVQIGEL